MDHRHGIEALAEAIDTNPRFPQTGVEAIYAAAELYAEMALKGLMFKALSSSPLAHYIDTGFFEEDEPSEQRVSPPADPPPGAETVHLTGEDREGRGAAMQRIARMK